MTLRCTKFGYLFHLVLLYQHYFVSSEDSNEASEIRIFTPCQLPNRTTEGFCVPVKNCQNLIKQLSGSDLKVRRCGPANENRKNPYVCCEKDIVQFSTTPLQSCGIPNIDSRIIGGETSEEKEFPWLGRILRKYSSGEVIFSCTGTLISPRVVLTAGHCLNSKALVEIGELHAVSFGEHKTECGSTENTCLKSKQTVLISEYLVHPDYDNSSINHDNDIALIILRHNLTFTNYVSSICLLEKNVNVVEYHIAGWGKTQTGSSSIVKRKATIPPYSWGKCFEKYQKYGVNITQRQICAGGVKGKDTCQGDSGGPLMLEYNNKWYIAGVVSLGVGCGTEGWPGIYVSVPDYVQWIREVIRMKVNYTL